MVVWSQPLECCTHNVFSVFVNSIFVVTCSLDFVHFLISKEYRTKQYIAAIVFERLILTSLKMGAAIDEQPHKANPMLPPTLHDPLGLTAIHYLVNGLQTYITNSFVTLFHIFLSIWLARSNPQHRFGFNSREARHMQIWETTFSKRKSKSFSWKLCRARQEKDSIF